MELSTIIRAFVYYVLIIMYTIIYNTITETLYIFELIMRSYNPIYKYIITKQTLFHYIKNFYAHMTLLVLRIVGIKIHLDADILSDRMIWISNHRSKFDGLMIQSLLYSSGAKNVSVVKKEISYFPIFGSFGQHADSIYINRNDDNSKKKMADATKATIYSENSILIFPEGATLSPESKTRSDKFANENNLPIFENVLIPKTVGFDIIKQHGQFKIIGNLTIRYNNPSIQGIKSHSFIDLFKIFPQDVYINVEYDDANTINLYDAFRNKNTNLNWPIFDHDYIIKNKCSKMLMFLNFILFVFFYYCCIKMPLVSYFIFVVMIYSSIRMSFQ